jgi:hypothetical protein
MITKKILTLCVVLSLTLSTSGIRAESMEDKFTQIPPNHTPGAGEFVHGIGYGKLLMRVMLLGSIGQQGVHYFPEGTDLMFAMVYAGGLTDTTKLNGIKIRRRNVKDLISVDLEDLIADGEKVPKLYDGDVVSVPYNWRRDMATITTFTGFVAAMTGFALSMVALSK